VKRDTRGTKRWTRGTAPAWTHELKVDEEDKHIMETLSVDEHVALSSKTDTVIKDPYRWRYRYG
jgi:hypothetical protein